MIDIAIRACNAWSMLDDSGRSIEPDGLEPDNLFSRCIHYIYDCRYELTAVGYVQLVTVDVE